MKTTTYLLMLSFSLLLACGKSNKSGGGTPATPNYNLIQGVDVPVANDLVAQINQRRLEAGLVPLERAPLLDAEAQTQAYERLNSSLYRNTNNIRFQTYGQFNIYGQYSYYHGGGVTNGFDVCGRVTDRRCDALGIGIGAYSRANLSPVESVLRRIQSDRYINILSRRHQRIGVGLARNTEGRTYWVVVLTGN